ncbi:MAG TPA: hypothetical protein VIF81_02155 [Pyrinomonadaceae bacterium]|jgi:hypothetical protein
MGNALDNQWRVTVTTIFIPFCDDQIEYHRGTIRRIRRMCMLELVLGVGVTILAFVIFRDVKQLSDTVFKLGPMFLGMPIPAFQYKIILVSRQSIISYSRWKNAFEVCLQNDIPPEAWLTDAITANMAEVAKPR